MKHADGHPLQPETAHHCGTPCYTAALTSTAAPAGPSMAAASGTYCPILFFDVAAFAAPGRDDDIHRSIRCGLYRILRSAFDRVNVPHTAYYRQDYGDGVLAVIPPTVAADTIAGLPIWLHLEIQRHNKCASPAAQIQLRTALHIGPVYWDDQGVSGQALIHTARLLDAQPVKDALATSDADLVFVVSAPVYDAVVRHSPQPAEATYRKIKARVKESSLTAWITVFGARTPTGIPNHQRHLTAIPDISPP